MFQVRQLASRLLFVALFVTGGGLAQQSTPSSKSHHHAAPNVNHAIPAESGLAAQNPSQGWALSFDRGGFLVWPHDEAWAWGLELSGYGFSDHENIVGHKPRVTADGDRVEYHWDDDLVEWYLNESRGIEHGYTLLTRPSGSKASATGGVDLGPLRFQIRIRGNLAARINPDGRGAHFMDSKGRVVLTYTGLVVFDADGRRLCAKFTSSSGGLLLTIDEQGARYPLTIDPIVQDAYLKASNTDLGDFFGAGVSVSGETIVIGAVGEDSDATGVDGDQSDNSAEWAGAAYVFVRDAGTWAQEAYLKAANTEEDDRFGGAVAVSGDTIVVGATGEDGRSGAVYVFTRSAGMWTQEDFLKASNADSGDRFGSSVAIDGDTLVVGARAEDSASVGVNGVQQDNSAIGSGAAYVFVRSAGVWSQQAYIKASNTNEHDCFGSSVAISGNTIAVGADYEDSSATGVDGDQSADPHGLFDSGAAYLFVRTGDTWNQEAYLKASNTDLGDRFATRVAVSGTTVVIGAMFEDSAATGVNGDETDNSASLAGAAYVFARNAGTWSQEAYLKGLNTESFDAFGASVAILADSIVVGATLEASSANGVDGDGANNDAPGSGAAYLFSRSGVVWSQVSYLKPSNGGGTFGDAVGLSADLLVAGASGEASPSTGIDGPQDGIAAPQSGAAFVFDLDPAGDHGALGANYCDALPNSTGLGAQIRAEGSSAVSENNFTLITDHLPSNVPALYIFGANQVQFPFGEGLRCIGVPITRIGPVVAASAQGVVSRIVDLAVPPAVGQIVAGAELNFQLWYRDGLGGPSGFNLSNGLNIVWQ